MTVVLSRATPERADTSRASGRWSLLSPGLLVVATVFVAVELAVSARYGLHRDELYFIAAGRHPAAGYVDQPPLAPLLTRLATFLFGSSNSAVRVFPALAGGGFVVVGGVIARLLGGGRLAALLTGLSLASAPVVLSSAHLANTTIYDLLAWSGIIALVLVTVRSERPRLWLAVGAVAGVGLENKDLPLLLLLALAVGLVVTGRARVLASRWVIAGALLAVTLWAPNLVWQAGHGWPELTMARALHTEHSAGGDYLTVLPAQLVYLGVAAVPLAVAGCRRLARERELRFLAVAAVLGLAYVVIDIPGRPYYDDGLLPVVFGAGSVAVEAAAARVSGRVRRALVAPPLGAVATLVLILPLLPVAAVGHLPWLHKLNYDLGETVGWPQLTAATASVYDGIPSAQRAQASIFTANYGEAAALMRYGPAYGLPVPLSGHNNYTLWGPGRDRDLTVVAVDSGDQLQASFASCRVALTFRSPGGVDNDENGIRISVCRGPSAPWSALWPGLRHYG